MLPAADDLVHLSRETYEKKYPPLPNYANERDLKKTFHFGGDSHKQPLVTRKSLKLLPGVFSFDPTVIKFLDRLTEELNENISVGLDERTGYSTNGVHASFDTLRTVAGYMMNPMSAVMQNNDDYRVELKLEAKYDVVGRMIARNVWRAIWSRYKPSAVKVAKNSSSGARRYTSDEEWKIDFAMFVYEQSNFDRVCKLVLAEDWLTLANEFEMVWMLYMQKREQVDAVGKPRYVVDEEYVRSGGKRGWSGNADKSVNLPGVSGLENFSATRARNVQAAIWSVNCICSIVSTGTMQAMFEDYPVLFHTNTAQQIEDAVNGSEVYASDVKEYDRSMSEDALDVVFETAREFWSDAMVSIAERLMFACYYSKPLDKDGKEGFWIGELFGKGKQVIAGNRSGHNWTALVAKVNKVIDELIALARMGMNIVGNEIKYMKQQGLVKLVNNGDDNLTCGSASFVERYDQFRKDSKSGHYLISREVGCVYSGNVLMRPNLGIARYTPVPRAQTALQKIYCAERSIGGHMRPLWDLGIHTRRRDAVKHPMGERVWEIHDRLFHDVMAPRYGSFSSLLIRGAHERAALLDPKFDVSQLTEQERSVIDDKGDLAWRGYTDEEVRPWVQDVLGIAKIPFSKFEHIVKQHYRGTLV